MYMELLEKAKVTPNFYCSEEYIKKSGMVDVVRDCYCFLTLPSKEYKGWVITPPLDLTTGELISESDHYFTKVWSDFPNWIMPGYVTSSFLDHEFIFDPKNFNHMDGGEWQTFRKNCRKFPARFTKGTLIYDRIENLTRQFRRLDWNEKLKNLFIGWLETMDPNTLIQDSDTMLRYLYHGKNLKALVSSKGELFGVNIWDENWKYINFRYCICKKDEFLSEHMRFLFYTDVDIQQKNKLVNDGGSVGNPGLEKFKRKMNPISVREVKSWKIIE